MQNRREFLKRASLMLAGGIVMPQLLTSCAGKASASESSKYIGLQLYSLRDLVKEEGIQKVLETASKMGYKNLETASYDNGKIYGLAPAEFKKMVNDLGMKCTSAHLGQAFTKEKEAEVMSWWDQAIDAHNELGVKYMVQPWMPVTDQTTLDDLKMYCDYFNEIGKRCQQNGMKFGYHNHAHEFQKVENQAVMLDYMIENTNPEYVFFQMDVYWIVRGQHSPVDYFNKYPGRFTVLHIKDDKEIGDSGMVGFDAIFRNAKVAGVKQIVAEIEGYSCPVEESVKKSLDYLLDAPFVKASYSK